MKTLMLNQKTGIQYSDIETYVTNTKIYQKNFVIFPTSLYITKFVDSGYNVGIQNIAESDKKNQTGEITAKQASGSGVKYAIVGHSERRINQKENDPILINKIDALNDENINIVYCVGESLVDYKLKNTMNVINDQLRNVLLKCKKFNSGVKLYVAYEPLWAIGTGMTPTNAEIEKVVRNIHDFLVENSYIGSEILYGGSVNDENIEVLSTVENLDGFLVGGASNNPEKVIKMCETLMNSTKKM